MSKADFKKLLFIAGVALAAVAAANRMSQTRALLRTD